MIVFSVDVGTTGAKVLLLDSGGQVLGQSFREYPVRHSAPGRAEQDADAVAGIVVTLLEETVKAAGIDRVDALCYSVQGDAVIPVDENDHPLLPAILGMDYRSAALMEELEQRLGGRMLFEKTGMPPHPIVSIGKMLWVERERPDIAAKTRRYLTYDGFLLRKLGAEEYLTDLTMASRSMACGLTSGEWDSEILAAIGVDQAKLPRIVPSGVRVGQMDATLARRIGLVNRPELVTGGHDQCCAAVGAGAVRPNLAVDSHGTAEVLSVSLDAPLVSAGMYDSQYPCYRHAAPGRFFSFALNHTGGVALRWHRDTLCAEERIHAEKTGKSAYDLMVEKMPEEPTGMLFLPHFNGSGTPHTNLDAKGALVGLTLATGRGEITKALLEGLAFELRLNAERFAQIGIPVAELRCVGGGASHPVSLQLKADVLGKPVSTLAQGQAASLGAGIIALTALGVYADLDAAVRALVRTEQTFVPQRERAAIYDERFIAYQALCTAIDPFCAALRQRK